MKIPVLRVGGVPEHFNMPWHWAIENQAFAREGIEVTWKDYPGGTGAMMQDLREGTLDVAVALTEGVVAEIVNRQSCRIVQYFVTSPLRWGIHVAATSPFQRVEELRDQVFAVSRLGSGSHLMAFVLGQQQDWATDRMQFEVVGGLHGARAALSAGTSVGFLWEKATTQPWVDDGEFRRIGVLDTPWPCFVVAARPALLDQQELHRMLTVLNRSVVALRNHPEAQQRIAQKYQLSVAEVQAWWATTQWAPDQRVARNVLFKVMQTLQQLSVITDTPAPEALCGGPCLLV